VRRLYLKLLEDQRFKQETGKKFPSLMSLPIVKKSVKDPFSLVHFSSLPNKLGINPNSGFNTPMGVYSYILTPAVYKDITQDRRSELSEFGTDRAYIHLSSVKPKYRKNIVVINTKGVGKGYTKKRYWKDLRALAKVALEGKVIRRHIGVERKVKAVAERMDYLSAGSFIRSWFGKLWYITKKLSVNITNWSKILRSIGIYGVFDYGAGLIHTSEMQQAVLLRGDLINRIGSGVNPLFAPSSSLTDIRGFNSFLKELIRVVNHNNKRLKRQDFKLYHEIDPANASLSPHGLRDQILVQSLNPKRNLFTVDISVEKVHKKDVLLSLIYKSATGIIGNKETIWAKSYQQMTRKLYKFIRPFIDQGIEFVTKQHAVIDFMNLAEKRARKLLITGGGGGSVSWDSGGKNLSYLNVELAGLNIIVEFTIKRVGSNIRMSYTAKKNKSHFGKVQKDLNPISDIVTSLLRDNMPDNIDLESGYKEAVNVFIGGFKKFLRELPTDQGYPMGIGTVQPEIE